MNARPLFQPERDSPEQIAALRKKITKSPGFPLLDDFLVAVYVLSERRQILYLNDRARALVLPSIDDPYGLRPGEAFGCVHAGDNPDGCGHGKYCSYCGLARSIANALSDIGGIEESRLEGTADARTKQVDLSIWTKTLHYGGKRFLLFATIDVTADNRREAFDRIFLHDLMNTAGSLSSLLRLLDPLDASFDEYLELTRGAADQLTDEILSHRVLIEAEKGELVVAKETVSMAELVRPVVDTYRHIAGSRGIKLTAGAAPDANIGTDTVLFRRVLANLLKNAVEACSRGEEVELRCGLDDGAAILTVHNGAVMNEDVKANLFKRSFSTKGRGRGLGTYAARLFVEEYLGGTIRCESAASTGTEFIVRIPL